MVSAIYTTREGRKRRLIHRLVVSPAKVRRIPAAPKAMTRNAAGLYRQALAKSPRAMAVVVLELLNVDPRKPR